MPLWGPCEAGVPGWDPQESSDAVFQEFVRGVQDSLQELGEENAIMGASYFTRVDSIFV